MRETKQRNDAPSTKRTRSFDYIIRVLIIILLLFLIPLFFLVPEPSRLQAGEVIDKLGDYQFPTGRQRLTITKDSSGNIHVTVQHRTTRFFIFPHSYSDTVATFESERDWFVSIDQYNRLWMYYGHWDRGLGKLRKMPSGGTKRYAPAVSLHGMHFISSGQLVAGGTEVTATGNWAGVPQQFFNRIPDRTSAQWGNVPPIPKSAPQFNRKQHSQLVRRLQQGKY